MSPSSKRRGDKQCASSREEVAVMSRDGSHDEDDEDIVHTSDAAAMHILQHAEVLSVVSEEELSQTSNHRIMRDMSKKHAMFSTMQHLHDEHDDEMPKVPSLNVIKEDQSSRGSDSKKSSKTLHSKGSSSFSGFLRRSGSSFGFNTKQWGGHRQSSFFEWMAATDDVETEEKEELSFCRKIGKTALHTYRKNEVFCLVILAILLARAYPPLGAVYLVPHITSTWIAVIFIFVLAGIGLKTEEFSRAFQKMPFNLFVQCFSFGAGSSMVFGVTRILVSIGAIDNGLADGMVVCSCLPMTISSVAVYTRMADGDEAAAIFNTAFGNMLAVILSPSLILLFLGVDGLDMDVSEVFGNLALRVVLPVVVGQVLQKTYPWLAAFLKHKKQFFQRAQLYAVIWIVYTVFCRTFRHGNDTSILDIFIMIVLQFLFYCLMMALAWYTLMFLFPDEPRLRVMGFFGCTHKTVAMGVPMIGAIYENDPQVGLYTLPLLVWYPLQLVVGSFLIPRLREFVEMEERRLQKDDDIGDDTTLEGDSVYGSSLSPSKGGSSLAPSKGSKGGSSLAPSKGSNGGSFVAPSKGGKVELKVANAKDIVRERYEKIDLEMGSCIFRSDTEESDCITSEEDVMRNGKRVPDEAVPDEAVLKRSCGPGPDLGDEAPPSKPIHSRPKKYTKSSSADSAHKQPDVPAEYAESQQERDHEYLSQKDGEVSMVSDAKSKADGRPKSEKNSKSVEAETIESSKSRRSRNSNQSSNTSGDKKRRQRSQKDCASDHSFYQVGAVYYEETVPRNVPEDTYCRGGCKTRIARHFSEIGILPSEFSPVYICQRCEKHAVCYVCWHNAKTPQWSNDSVWNLYG